MNSGSCEPQIAAVELFTAHLYMLQVLIPDVQNHFQPRKLSLELCLKDDIRNFSEMRPRDSRVSSVFGSNRHSWFSCQLSLSKLWASEKASWELWLNMRAKTQQSDQEVLHNLHREQSIN